MTEFENNVRLMRHWQKQDAILSNTINSCRRAYYEEIVDKAIDDLQSPSIQFDFSE